MGDNLFEMPTLGLPFYIAAVSMILALAIPLLGDKRMSTMTQIRVSCGCFSISGFSALVVILNKGNYTLTLFTFALASSLLLAVAICGHSVPLVKKYFS